MFTRRRAGAEGWLKRRVWTDGARRGWITADLMEGKGAMTDERSGRMLLEAQDAALRRRAPLATTGAPLEDLVAALVTSIRSSRLAVVVGAGLSMPAGLPTWGELLRRLADDLVPPTSRPAFDILARQGSSLGTARLLKEFLGVRELFPQKVEAALYGGGYDPDAPNPGLDLVVALAELAVRANARLDVITYNFDDLLETALSRAGMAFTVVADEQTFALAAGGVNIFHVHGLLPAGGEAAVGYAELVLSEDEFHSLMSARDRWQNRVQAQAYAHKDCLFVGLSLTDPNLRRLLDLARAAEGVGRRFAVVRRVAAGQTVEPGGTALDADTAEALNELNRMAFDSLRASTAYVDDFADLSLATRSLRAS
jgi:hypothetical protein